MYFQIKSFIKKKNFKQYLLFVSIITIFLLGLMELFHSFDNRINKISNIKENRILYLSTHDDINKLENELTDIKHICEINLINNNLYNDYEIVVDEYVNVQITMEKINDKGYFSYIYNIDKHKELNIYNNIRNLLLLIIISQFLIIYWVMHSVIKNILHEEMNDIALLKSMGYKNILILKINLLKLFLLTVLSLILSFILILILNCLISDILYINSIEILKLFFIVIICYSIIIFIVNLTFINKIKKISPIALFN